MKLNQCIYFLTTRLSRELKKLFDKKLESLSLTSSMWCVLMAIIENGEITQKELSVILSIEGPTTTKIIDNLEKRGFITRVPHETDRRAYKISLTEKGKNIQKEIFKYGDCFMKEVKSNLTEKEKEQLHYLLNKIYDNIKTIPFSHYPSC